MADIQKFIEEVKSRKIVLHFGYMYRHNPYISKLLKRINVAKMCSTTNLNVTRIRNYINGKVLYLSPEEKRIINEYCHSLLNQTRRS